MNFNSILIGSEDPRRLADYYTKLFGEPAYDDGGYVTWMLGGGSVSVGPHSEVHGKNAAPGRMSRRAASGPPPAGSRDRVVSGGPAG